MRILLTNDDGIFAPGLAAIYKELVKIGEVTVVAPADGQSGASHSITFSEPLACYKVDIKGQFSGFSVEGSPADCVKLAVLELCEEPVDLVVSGINNGANAGINVYYSGTVAAAMEGAFLKIPAVSMSLSFDDKMDFGAAAEYCVEVLEKMMPLKKGHVANINIPRLSVGKPKGVKVVPQSSKGFEEYFTREIDGQGQIVFQLSGGLHRIDESATDMLSLQEGYITVTALDCDMTNYEINRRLGEIEW